MLDLKVRLGSVEDEMSSATLLILSALSYFLYFPHDIATCSTAPNFVFAIL